MKEIDINGWRDIPCSWVGRNNIVKITILPNTIYGFNAIPIKLSMAFFTELKQKNSQLIWKHERYRRAKAVLRKKNEAGGVKRLDFRLYHLGGRPKGGSRLQVSGIFSLSLKWQRETN